MKSSLLSLALFLLTPAVLAAQGILVIPERPIPLPRPIPVPPPTSYQLQELSVDAVIKDQVAEVQVTQTFANPGPGTIEAQFLFPLPYDGAINQMTLMVNGKEYPAKLLNAKEARERYQEIVRKNRDPALLEWIGTGMFQTSVFPIPAGETRTVNLHYTQLLRHDQSLTDFLFPLRTAKYTSKPLDKLRLNVVLNSSSPLKNLYSPTHPVDIKRDGEKRATITYETTKVVPSDDFQLLFDTGTGTVGANLLTYHPQGGEDGYFLLLATPAVRSTRIAPAAKTVTLVIDKSGSMSGKKIEQVREAARFFVRNLNERDLFNIVTYDGTVQTFRPELEAFNDESRVAAENFVDQVFAGGSTNISDALLQTLGQLKDDSRPSFILFLTDGVPTAGETNESKIAALIKEANKVRARLLVFGVGHDVNSRLLDRLSRENYGISEYVRPNQDIEESVARVMRRIGSPVFVDVALRLELDGGPAQPINRVYPGGNVDLFAGEQLVVVGRYKGTGATKITLTGRVNGAAQTHEFAGELVGAGSDRTNAFIEKLWATRRIGELIDELDLKGRNEELIKELVDLSTKHGILTPYTAFLADDSVRPELASSANTARAYESLQQLDATSGQSGFFQRAAKSSYKNAMQAPAGDSLQVIGEPLPATLVGEPPRASSDVRSLSNVRQIGSQTLYRRGKLLMTPETASLDVEKDRERISIVERFTPEYFELVAANSRAENELLSEQGAEEELLVPLQGKIYLIK